MTITLTEFNGVVLAEILADGVVIANAQDALDVLANCGYQGARRIIVHQKNIIPEFFDLKTGIAGDVLQKFSTYKSQLAIVGDFSGYSSKSLKDFIYESNGMGRIRFVTSVDEARDALLKTSS